MKRNWEIIRAILVSMEGATTPNAVVSMKSFANFDEQEVAYNMRLLNDADCIEARILESSIGDNKIAVAYTKRMTSKGHDLLDTIRSESVWSKIKDKFESKGLDMSIDLVVKVGKQVVDAMLS